MIEFTGPPGVYLARIDPHTDMSRQRSEFWRDVEASRRLMNMGQADEFVISLIRWRAVSEVVLLLNHASPMLTPPEAVTQRLGRTVELADECVACGFLSLKGRARIP